MDAEPYGEFWSLEPVMRRARAAYERADSEAMRQIWDAVPTRTGTEVLRALAQELAILTEAIPRLCRAWRYDDESWLLAPRRRAYRAALSRWQRGDRSALGLALTQLLAIRTLFAEYYEAVAAGE